MKTSLIASTVAALAFASPGFAASTSAGNGNGKTPVTTSTQSEISSAGKNQAICDR